MKRIYRFALAATALLIAQTASAQNLSSAYFLDGYAQGHELNPAKEYDRKGYFGFPFSNINVSSKGNISTKSFIYKNPNGKGLVTYMHPSISTSEAMDGFHKNNKILSDMRIELLSVGFHAFKGYNTLTVGVRSNIGLNIPSEFFELTKDLGNKNYNISNFGGTVMAWGEIGLGHSHQVTEAIRIGAKAKVLIGGAYANLKMDNLSLDLQNENQWTATANATVEAGVKGISWGKPKEREYSDLYKKNHGLTPDASGNYPSMTYKEVDFDNVDVDGAGINGLGAAFDLGAEWDLEKQFGVKGLKVSASVLDLGFIKWKDVAVAKNSGEPFVFEGFKDIKIKDGQGEKIDDQFDDFGDKFEDLYRLEDNGVKSKTTTLGATLNVAAEYALPSYRHLKFGFLSTTRIQGKYSWNEERFAVTISPAKAFEFSTNLGVGTLGTNVGWIMNIHPRGFNLFLGSDHSIVKLSKQYMPLGSCYNFCMGVNFPIGKSRIQK